MDKSVVFAKTDGGREALTGRPAGLTPRLRSLLIMADGKRTVADLDKMLGGEGTAAPLLEQLVAQGWIQVVVPAPGAARAPGAAPAQGVAAGAPPSVFAVGDIWPLSDARRRVVRFINDQLGPMGEPLAMRIEDCKTAAELQAALPRVRDGLRNFKSTSTVQRFDDEIVVHLPKA
ncbi:MAG: hypothetical protein MUF76_03130 [Hydrogenophaga sp.]|jgi:hypothetical protein|nr:hypothetical protein [Hydrogenophaga sp.]